MNAADKAVTHILRRIIDTPRLAYYFADTESFDLLTAAHAEDQAMDVAQLRADVLKAMTSEKPSCRNCGCPDCVEARA